MHFMLVSSRSGQLMETIASRCQDVAFALLSEDELELVLSSSHLNDADRALVVSVAAGKPGTALRLIEEQKLSSVTTAIADLQAMMTAGVTERIVYAKSLADAEDPVEVVSWWLSWMHAQLRDDTVSDARKSSFIAAIEAELGARKVELPELLEQADIVSLHVPLLPSTQHLISVAELDRMRPDAFLINTARGPVVDEQALVAALEAGKLGGVGLDVFEFEPQVHPVLRNHPKVICSPHTASATHEARARMTQALQANVEAWLEGRPLPNAVPLPDAS
jgi:hypothetical protein